MITRPQKTSLAKFCFTLLVYFLCFSNTKATVHFIDVASLRNSTQPLVILDKNHFESTDASELIVINGHINSSFIVDGVGSYRINMTSEVITEEKLESNRTFTTSNVPVTISAVNLIVHEKDDDSENNVLPSKKQTTEFSHLDGYSKIIFRVYENPDSTEIEFVDERLSILVDHKKPENNPDNNLEIVAMYLDTIVVNPPTEITHIENLIDNIDVPTLNQDIANIRSALLNLPNSNSFADALNLMHPIKFADIDSIVFSNHSLLYSNICQHFNELGCCIKSEADLNIWGKAFGNFQNRNTDGSLTGYNSNTNGIFIGIDCCPVKALCFGSGFAFTYDRVEWKRNEADATNNSYYGFLYSSLHSQSCFFEAIVSLSYSSIEGNRFIRLSPNLNRKAKHENNAWAYGGRLKGGVNFNLPYQISLQLYDSTDLGSIYNGAFIEEGASSLNLQVNKRSSWHFRNELGFQFSGNYLSPDKTTCWTPSIGLGWVYKNPLSGNHMTANFQSQKSQFTVNTWSDPINQISPQASLTISSITGTYLSAYYDGEFGNGWNSNEVSMHVGKNF